MSSECVRRLGGALSGPVSLATFRGKRLIILSTVASSRKGPLVRPKRTVAIINRSKRRIFAITANFLSTSFRDNQKGRENATPSLCVDRRTLRGLSKRAGVFQVTFSAVSDDCSGKVVRRLRSVATSSPNVAVLSQCRGRRRVTKCLLASEVVTTKLSTMFLLVKVVGFVGAVIIDMGAQGRRFTALRDVKVAGGRVEGMLL